MSPRKRRTFYPKRRRQPSNHDRPSVDPIVDAEARRLADTFGLEQLQGVLLRAQEAYDDADRESQERPSPQALSQYRAAERALAAAQRAINLVSTTTPSG